MKGTMKVGIMLGIGKIGYETRDIPQPKDNEVLVKLEYVGICGSDLHYYETGAIGDYVVKPPFVLGHEPGGTVVEVGKDVKHLWSLPIVSAALFLIGTWIFFDIGEMAFVLYAVVYLALGIVTMLISMIIRKKVQR